MEWLARSYKNTLRMAWDSHRSAFARSPGRWGSAIGASWSNMRKKLHMTDYFTGLWRRLVFRCGRRAAVGGIEGRDGSARGLGFPTGFSHDLDANAADSIIKAHAKGDVDKKHSASPCEGRVNQAACWRPWPRLRRRRKLSARRRHCPGRSLGECKGVACQPDSVPAQRPSFPNSKSRHDV